MKKAKFYCYNDVKLKMVDKALVEKFRVILNESNYRFIYNSLIGSTVNIDNWMEEDKIISILSGSGINKVDKDFVEMLLLGYSKPIEEIKDAIGEDGIRFLTESNMFYQKDALIINNGYVLLPVNELFLIVSLPCIYKNGKAQFSDIYIGQDSMRLQQMLKNKHFNNVLDLCAGSGVQGLHYIKKANNICAVELNDNAFVAASLNAILNEGINYNLYKGDLYEALPKDRKKFDCIISNPPYVPIPKNIEVAMCGDGGEDGMDIARRIIDGYPENLQTGGHAYMVLECIGDEERPYILDYFKSTMKKGIINVSIIDKSSLLFQAHASAKLASYGNENLYSFYFEKWIQLFNSMEATAIYPVVIEYINVNCEWTENIIKRCQTASLDTIYKLKEDVVYKLEDKAYYDLYQGERRKLSVRKDVFETLLKNDGNKILDFIPMKENSKEFISQMYEYLNTVVLLQEQGLLKSMQTKSSVQD